jgi:hypothetical protein
MSVAQSLALHQQLLVRVRAAPADIDVLSSLMQEYHALTRSLNESPRLSSNVPLQALNAQVLMELMGKLAPAFVAACQALHG